jgi:hypothetical protein
MIPPAYVITLNDDLGKQEVELNNVGIYPRIFKGVDGRKGEYKAHEDRVTKVCNILCPNSVKSIGLSHVLLCEKIFDEGIPLALIFEDDAYPIEGLNIENEVNKVLSEVPDDWDVIRLHCDIRCKNGSNKIQNLVAAGSTAAYIVNHKGAEKIKNMLVLGHIDQHQYFVINVYKSKQNLFWTDEKLSTNRTSRKNIVGSMLNKLLPPTSGEKTWHDMLAYKLIKIPIIGLELNAITFFTIIIIIIIGVLIWQLKN